MARRIFTWKIIRIPVIHLVFAGVAVVLLIATVLAIILGPRFMDQHYINRTRKALERAEILFTRIEENKLPKEETVSAKLLINKAEHFLSVGLPREAYGPAEEAVQHLEYFMASYKPEEDNVEGRYAKITELNGVVELLPPGTSEWIIADLNQLLRRGTKIRTQNLANAVLKFDDGSSIQVKENSLLMIRELAEDEMTQAKSSDIELGTSHIEALIKESKVSGSNFRLTMPDSSLADVKTESNLEVMVDNKNKSVVKVFMGRVEVRQGDQRVALASREAVVLDPQNQKKKTFLKTVSIPLPPRLMYPANVQLITIPESQKEPIFYRWTMVQEAEKYRLEIAKDYYFFDRVLMENTNTNRYSTSILEPGNYYWRVSSINKAGLTSEPSPFNSFRIVMATALEAQPQDLTPPQVLVDRITLLGHIIDVSGKTEPNANLYVNEQKEEVREDGTFRVLVEFKQSGPQIVFIESYDSSGNVTTLRREITIPETSS